MKIFRGLLLVILSVQPLSAGQKQENKVKKMVAGSSVGAKAHGAREKQRKHKNPGIAQEAIYKWFETYSEVVSLVEKKAFRKVDFAQFIQDSLKAAVSEVDAHSAFFTQKSYDAAKESTQGEFSGVGVSVITKTPEDDALVIIDVIEGGPSFKAGLQGGDKIVEVEGEKLRGLSSDEVITLLKGKVGTKVKVKVIRDKKPLTFAITRDIIKDQTSICYHFPQQNVYYLSLKIFNELAGQQIKDLIARANDGTCQGLVIDLRNNPGGTLDSAIEMAGFFVDKGSVVVSTKNRSGKVIATYRTKTDPVLKSDVPIFILINNFTASAAEILAGCLSYYAHYQKNLMVFLVGIPTFGKGSVQELIPIKNGCALKLTTMLYYLPDKSSLQAKGIDPDFTIKPKLVPHDEMKWIEEFYGKETSLKNHITVDEVAGNEGKKSEPSAGPGGKTLWQRIWGKQQEKKEAGKKAEDKGNEDEDSKKSFEEKQREAIASDIMIHASINMIHLLNIAKKDEPDLAHDRKKAHEFLKKHYVTDDKVEVVKIR